VNADRVVLEVLLAGWALVFLVMFALLLIYVRARVLARRRDPWRRFLKEIRER
jgi:hypothetical protein